MRAMFGKGPGQQRGQWRLDFWSIVMGVALLIVGVMLVLVILTKGELISEGTFDVIQKDARVRRAYLGDD